MYVRRWREPQVAEPHVLEPVGCVKAFMQLAGTRVGDHRGHCCIEAEGVVKLRAVEVFPVSRG